jgi:hypothetical protein
LQFFTSAISSNIIRFISYAFIDDTDLIQTAHNGINSYSQVVEELQCAANTWEGGLYASGGAVVLEKSHWCLVNFKWTGSTWKYSLVKDTPAQLIVTNIHGNRKVLK